MLRFSIIINLEFTALEFHEIIFSLMKRYQAYKKIGNGL